MQIDLDRFLLIAGPCVVEGEEHLRQVAGAIHEQVRGRGIQWVLKASYDKANRSKVDSFRGIGANGLAHLVKIGREFDAPITTDIHSEDNADIHPDWPIDIIQIPAMLSRQTDILTTAAKTGKIVNIKKGQTIHPGGVRDMVEKLAPAPVIVTERGSQFGYGDTVVDMRYLMPGTPLVNRRQWKTVLDVTHTVVNWVDSFALMRAGMGVGVDGIFVEMGSTKCDKDRSIPIRQIGRFIEALAWEMGIRGIA